MNSSTIILIFLMIMLAVSTTEDFMAVAGFIHDTKCSISDTICY